MTGAREYFVGFEHAEAMQYDGTHKSAIALHEFIPSLFENEVVLVQFGEKMPAMLTRLTDVKGGQWVVTMLGGGVRNWNGRQEYDTPWSRLPEDLFPMRTGGQPSLFNQPVQTGAWVVMKTTNMHMGIEKKEPVYATEWILGKADDAGKIRPLRSLIGIHDRARVATHRQAVLSNEWTTPWEPIEKESDQS